MSVPHGTMGQAELDAIVAEWNDRMAAEPRDKFGDPATRARVADEMIAGLNKRVQARPKSAK